MTLSQLKKQIVDDTCLIYDIKRPISVIVSDIEEMEILKEKLESTGATSVLSETKKHLNNLGRELEASKEFYGVA